MLLADPLADGYDFLGSWVYPNKGTRSPTGLRLISDTHDGLPTGLKMACDG
jgi:hypothetical protein